MSNVWSCRKVAEQDQPFEAGFQPEQENELFLYKTDGGSDGDTNKIHMWGSWDCEKESPIHMTLPFFCMISGLMVHSTSSTKYSGQALDRQSGSWDCRMFFTITILPWTWLNRLKNGWILSPKPFSWFESLWPLCSRKGGPTHGPKLPRTHWQLTETNWPRYTVASNASLKQRTLLLNILFLIFFSVEYVHDFVLEIDSFLSFFSV